MSQYDDDLLDPRNPRSPYNLYNVHSPFYKPQLRDPGSGIFILLVVILVLKGYEWFHAGLGFLSARVAASGSPEMWGKIFAVGVMSAIALLVSCVGIFWVKDFATKLIFGFLVLVLVFVGLMMLCPSLLN